MDYNRYNPEGSALRRDQKELLRMLNVLDSICKQNNIPWWLSSGTLLGAARHKGFIPWDDDMDIVLLKDDYKRLEKILCEMEDDEFVFHCPKTDIDYVYVFGKFRKKEGRVQSSNRRYRYYKWAGIGFDIFQMEKTNYISAFLAHKIYYIIQKPTEYIHIDWLRKSLIRVNEFICDKLVFPVLRLLGKYNPQEEYHYVLGTGWPKHTFFMNNTFPLQSVEFEGEKLPAPKDMDSYLTLVYGNWRKLPSEESIKETIHCQEYRDEIFGKGE